MEELKALISDDMRKFFTLRTRAHLYLVNKWHNKIAKLSVVHGWPVDLALFNQERDDHDQGKWEDPEVTPYILLTWRYEQRRRGGDLELPESIKEAIHKATFHHIKSHRHHPEFWDETSTLETLNKNDRDKPSGVVVDGTKMPMTYVAAMVADWMAMSEELGGHPAKWAKDNIGVRWSFTDEQERLIYNIIERVWDQQNYVPTVTSGYLRRG